MPTSAAQTVEVDGRRLRVSNLDKVLYPETGTTKADVIAYYLAIAPALIPYAANRALTRKRWPNGVGTEEEPLPAFFEKDLGNGVPDWVQRRTIEHSSGPKQYPLVEDRATLAWLAQAAALELHVPQWQFARSGGARNPDRMVLDFDPGPGVDLPTTAGVALLAKDILEGMGLTPFPVTSGSKGIHVYAALDGSLTSDQVSAVAHELARALEADNPDLIVSDMKKSLREGRVLIDWSQNNGKKTTIAPYSLRGRPHPTVAAPRTWEELREPGLAHLLYSEVLERYESIGDPLAPLLRSRDAGLEPTPEHMARFVSTPEAQDRLAKYRSMRDAAKTPEPVPDDLGLPGSGRSFVIQEHHARRLHYDFRLEHDGVLVSWAIPKGPPTDPKVNHLAVPTEDHPLEYGTFEGEIPKGEYGGGLVKIWDAGEYDVEKWRDGKEVIAVLHGRPDGGLGGEPRRFALIHTGQAGDEKNWMIHLMVDKAHAAATAAQPEPAPMGVMLTKSATRLPGAGALPGGTRYEPRWDGVRMVVTAAEDGAVQLWSAQQEALTASFPELVEAADGQVPPGCSVDGVAVRWAGERLDPDSLERRLTAPAKTVRRLADEEPANYVAFDLLTVAGTDLRDRPYSVRRQLLEELAKGWTPPLSLSPSTDDPEVAKGWRRDLAPAGIDGVVAKGADQAYEAGRREWVEVRSQTGGRTG
ncbi:non-homologous end-joining DNA ligase [Leifsonia sp. AG29]|uniref:non-homologous end-joining DNA ligase n=1 Tax=Leifsonia sp. AG29 TaxID=2598860 RepID=UPI00131E547F|nr:non-homologous end-joining DNA ligase [Leifsonia sp. AG29]